MKTLRAVLVVFAGLAMLLVSVVPSYAGGRGGKHHGGDHSGGHHRGKHHRGHFHSAPSYSWSGMYYQYSPAYVAPVVPKVVVERPVTYIQREPLQQREVVYPHGKYVLHGDGVTQLWQWVWIPAAPQ